MTTPLLQLQGISKKFGDFSANQGIDLTLHSGRIHALLGENGAGKSTLVNMLYGLLTPDEGQMLWQGQRMTLTHPQEARALGIGVVFQHFKLFDAFSVVENLKLALHSDLPLKTLRQQVIDLAHTYGLNVHPDHQVHALSAGERQRVEILRCLLENPKLLILDEPTSVLTPDEVTKLFDILQRLKHQGHALIFISHKLEEVMSLCDEVTILRKGQRVHFGELRHETADSLAIKMMGEAPVDLEEKPEHEQKNICLSLSQLHLDARDEFDFALDIHQLDLYQGEILGIAGIAGNGQERLFDLLCGEETHSQGMVFSGQDIGNLGTAARNRLGILSVPTERLGRAAVPQLSLEANALLGAENQPGLVKKGWIFWSQLKDFAQKLIGDFAVASAKGEKTLAAELSGGNLQKFIMGRALSQAPKLLIVSNPTWGVDLGSATLIRNQLIHLRNQGGSLLVISEDLEELLQISDRLAVIYQGKLSPALPCKELNMMQIGRMMGGAA